MPVTQSNRTADFLIDLRQGLRGHMASTTFEHMTVTPKGSTSTRARPPAVRLRTDAYDVLAAAKGYVTVESQAELHGVNRGTMFRLRAGRRLPRVDLAMRIASDLGTTVEFLFEPVK